MFAPLVSAIMPTANRRWCVAQSIQYFLRQDYPHKELIIVDDGLDRIEDLVPPHPDIRYLRHQGPLVTGTKRNIACDAARGDLILHWDDDDWQAPWRIRYQVAEHITAGKPVSGLQTFVGFRASHGDAWEYHYHGSAPFIYGATLCYDKSRWQRKHFQDCQIGEDTFFVGSLPIGQWHVCQDSRFLVLLIHPNNTSRKQLTSSSWKALDVQTVRDRIGPDWPFYADLRLNS